MARYLGWAASDAQLVRLGNHLGVSNHCSDEAKADSFDERRVTVFEYAASQIETRPRQWLVQLRSTSAATLSGTLRCSHSEYQLHAPIECECADSRST